MTYQTQLDQLRDEQQLLVAGLPDASRLVEEVIGWPRVTDEPERTAELVVRLEVKRLAESDEAREVADLLREAAVAGDLLRAVGASIDRSSRKPTPFDTDAGRLVERKVEEVRARSHAVGDRWFRLVGGGAPDEHLAEPGRWLIYLLAVADQMELGSQ